MNNLNQPITSTGRTLALSAFKQTLGLSLLTFSVMQANLALAAVTPAPATKSRRVSARFSTT
ncbi:Glycoside hydrolase protein [Pseudomonas syringae pv. aptata]|uniref:Glycoside hydrolase protein n=1 Tax=Pseudomonas syringae pv. aptata TaxID=83167 RepID=A0A3M3X9U4_PSEAP|nr:Glycoside hydrolase protein [Pseudomonas syringae pv. aptata]